MDRIILMEVSLAENVTLVPLGENYLKFALPCTRCRSLRTTHKMEKRTDYDELRPIHTHTTRNDTTQTRHDTDTTRHDRQKLCLIHTRLTRNDRHALG